jgi:hypothetical protein
MPEVSEWPYSDYPTEPRYELKLVDLPEEGYEYYENPDDDQYFFNENGFII